MRIRIAVPDAHVTPEVLNAALEATTRANEAMLASGDAPPITELIERGKVKWKPEPFKDGEHFDLANTVAKRGWGDCDDLAPALAAELRSTGQDEGARARVKRSGPNLWHAVTQLSDGRILDPSVWAGMRKRKAVSGASVMPLLAEGAVLGLKHHAGRWASRCDLPIDGAPVALSGVAFGRSPLEAVTEAVDAATVVGETSDLVHPADVARALAVQAACSGADYMDVLNGVGEYVDGEELGSIFSSISRGLKSALPMAASFVPIPGAGLAAQMATHLIPGTRAHAAHQAEAASQAEHPPPGGVSVTRSANGAIVVRF